jgi:predicted site-specific integrase-resolvase
MRMVFTEKAAGAFVGVTGQTVTRWAHTGLIPFGVRPLQDGKLTFHRSDLEYARDVVKPTRKNTGPQSVILKRAPRGIVRSRA